MAKIGTWDVLLEASVRRNHPLCARLSENNQVLLGLVTENAETAAKISCLLLYLFRCPPPVFAQNILKQTNFSLIK
jgi:hypothetical protein